jgi:transposase-like protein
MSSGVLTLQDPLFHDPDAARAYLESIRWPDGKPVCPHCGQSERPAYRITGKSARPGLCRCPECRKQFTVTVGTIFEGSHVPLNVWLLAFHLLCSSKKGFSAAQLARNLNVSMKTAWHMGHRIRWAMTEPAFSSQLSGTVEVDETYIGGKTRRSNKRQYKPLDPSKPDMRLKKTGRGSDKTPVVALVERGGQVRSMRVANVTAETLGGAIRRHVAKEAHLRTDSFPSYKKVGREYASHETVNHADEYVRGDAHTNTAENVFSLLKRGVNGIYHHVSEEHLPRYLAEFDFRFNARHLTDTERTQLALTKTAGKRLMYRDSLRPASSEGSA